MAGRLPSTGLRLSRPTLGLRNSPSSAQLLQLPRLMERTNSEMGKVASANRSPLYVAGPVLAYGAIFPVG